MTKIYLSRRFLCSLPSDQHIQDCLIHLHAIRDDHYFRKTVNSQYGHDQHIILPLGGDAGRNGSELPSSDESD